MILAVSYTKFWPNVNHPYTSKTMVMYLKFEMWLFRHPSNHKCGLQRNTISHHCPSTVISNKGIVLQKIKNLQSFFWNCKNIMFRNGWKNCKYKFFSVLQIFFCNYKKIIVSFIGLTTGCLEEVLERGVAKFELNYLFVCVLLLRYTPEGTSGCHFKAG